MIAVIPYADLNTALEQLINAQASYLMYELGHNFGLNHGGNETQNWKPNHYSIMNYMLG
jgi:predicted Zn-dependent protease